jgi:hypothetical protein
MSRAGYSDDCDDPLAEGRWRAAVRSAMRGKRGQAFLREALAALDAMPDKRLVREHLVVTGWQPWWDGDEIIVGGDVLTDRRGVELPMGSVCLLGAVGQARGMPDIADLDPDDMETVAPAFGIADAMAREIVYWNDEGGDRNETPEQRWTRMRAWVEAKITKPAAEAA